MQLTFALRERSTGELTRNLRGRKTAQLRRGLRAIVREHAKEAHAIAFMLSAYRTGRMQRLLKVTYTESKLGFNLGWAAQDFRREGVFFYPPRVVLGLGQRANDNITPAWRFVRPRFQRAVIVFAASGRR